jgi:exonuclease III
MTNIIHRPLKVIAFNANGISKQRYELSKQLQDLHIDVALFSETHLKPHERFYVPNFHFYRIDRHPERKGGTAVAVRKGIPHKLVDLPPLVSVEATEVCIPIGNREILLVAVYKSPGRTWSDADIAEFFSLRHKCILAGDLNAKHPSWNSTVSNPSGEKLLQLQVISKFQHHNAQPITPLWEMEMYCILWCIRISDYQMSSSLDQITYQQYSTSWITLELKPSQHHLRKFGSGFKA